MGIGGETRRKRVGIVGGGIGGLTTAAALVDSGIEVLVFERADELPAKGAALLLWSNALSALEPLGLSRAVLAHAAPIEVTEFRKPSGEALSRLAVGEWSREIGAPSVVVRRPKLIEILAGAVPEGSLHMGARFSSFSRDGGGVRISFERGEDVVVDALIGADGIHSRVREQLFGPEAPRELGFDAWVGVTHDRPSSMKPGITTATVGQGPRFWSACLPAQSAFWYATLSNRSFSVSTREELCAVFRGWHAPVEELIASTLEGEIIRTRIADRLPIESWGHGPITLLGDAAHPSTPDLGQGACQAIESAVVLASALRQHESVSDALRRYELRRMRRTASISRLCWMTSNNSTIEAPLLCGLRDLAMRTGFETVARSSLRWVLAGHGE